MPPLRTPHGDSRTRYLSSPRAIRTNGRIRQLSRYIFQPLAPLSPSLSLSLFYPPVSPPPATIASTSFSIRDPTAGGSSSSFSLALYLGLRRSPYIRSRRKCTPVSATRSGFSFHAQWQSPFDADSRLTRLIRSSHCGTLFSPRRPGRFSTGVVHPIVAPPPPPAIPANGPHIREK